VTCQEFVEFLMAYLEDELGSGQRSTFQEHLEACPPCTAYLETYQETVKLGKSLCEDPQGPVPDEVPEELVQAILAAKRQES
jgi:anti-sigma factor RsiW